MFLTISQEGEKQSEAWHNLRHRIGSRPSIWRGIVEQVVDDVKTEDSLGWNRSYPDHAAGVWLPE